MNYTARYGLEFNPFLKNSKEVLVETQEYKETCTCWKRAPLGAPQRKKPLLKKRDFLFFSRSSN